MSRHWSSTRFGGALVAGVFLLLTVAILGCGTQAPNETQKQSAGTLAAMTTTEAAAPTTEATATTTEPATTTTQLATTTSEATTTTAFAPTTTTILPATTTTEEMTTTTVAPVEEDTVYITKTGEKYHRAGCSYLSKSKIPISRADAIAQGYEPCKRCKP